MDVRRTYQAAQLVRVHRENLTPRASTVSARRVSSDVGVKVAISKNADVLSQLSALQDSDEERFKEVIGAVGSNLKAAANPNAGAVGSELGALADQLLRVAKTGDLSALQQSSGNVGFDSTQRALAAYKSNMPTRTPSSTVSQALDYVLSAARSD